MAKLEILNMHFNFHLQQAAQCHVVCGISWENGKKRDPCVRFKGSSIFCPPVLQTN